MEGNMRRKTRAPASASPTSSMVVRFSVEVNSKKTNQPLADLDGDHWAPVAKTGNTPGVLFRH
jgi:hypothetical protein